MGIQKEKQFQIKGIRTFLVKGTMQTSTSIEEKRKKGPAVRYDIDENTESFNKFVRRFRNSPVTKKDYVNAFRRLVHCCNLPETKARILGKVELGDSANTDLLLFEGDTKKIQNTIKHYIDYQYDRGLSPVTMKSHYNAIKHFYESNEI